MGNVILDESSLNDIGDAIRSKLGVETTYLPREMAAAIMSIDTKDVIEGYLYEGAFYSDSGHTQQLTGEAGKLYIDIPTSGMYRWGGSQYVKVSGALTLGETEDTAYRGDRGKVAYDHAQLRGSQFSSALYKIGTNSEGHVTSATPVEKSDITALGIPSQDSTYTPSSSAPQMNGTASAGTSVKYSRGDHVHPTDTSRMAADLKGAANGVAELDASGKVPSSQLPSYVDDVLEYATMSDFPATGETGKIYVATSTNETYRWSGSAYVSISNPLNYATQAEAEAGTENSHVMTPLRTKQAIAANVSEYTLPPMSPTTRGGAKLGSGLSMDGDVLSVALEAESDGTDAGPIVELTAKGHAEQVTTTGKNLKSPTARTVTASGVTYTAAADGKITLTGTASAADNFTIYNGQTFDSGTFTVSLHGNDKAVLSNSASVQTYENPAVNTFVIRILSGETYNESFYVQIEAGSTATAYEPYTGGAPSPSPDYPQEIQVVRGRNLVPAVESGVINSTNGNYADNSAYVRTQKIPVVSGATYTLSLSKSYDGSAVAVVCWNKDGTFNSRLYSGGMSTKRPVATFTVPSGVNRVAFTAGLSNYPETPSTVSNVQLELGSIATPYVPYGHVGLEVQNKNLLDLSKGTIHNAYGLNTSIDGDVINVKGTYSGNNALAEYRILYNAGISTSNKLKPFTEDPHVNGLRWATASEDSIVVSLKDLVNNTYYDISMRIMAYDGDEPVSYTPFYHVTTTPIPLPSRGWVGALPDGTADTLTLDGAGKVVWERATEMVTEVDSSGWAINGDQTIDGVIVHQFIKEFAGKRVGQSIAINGSVMCDTLDSYDSGDVHTLSSFDQRTANGKIEIFLDIAGSTLADLATFFAAHPTTFLYPLATPVTEDMGYVDGWTNDFPEGCVLSIPELDDLGVRYVVDDAAVTLARQYYDRARSEYEDRIIALESAVAELIAGA